VAAVINRYAVPRLFALNAWDLEELPRIAHSEIGVPDLPGLAEYINKLVGAQVLTPGMDLEQHLREAAKLPEADVKAIELEQQEQEELDAKAKADALARLRGDGDEEEPEPEEEEDSADFFQVRDLTEQAWFGRDPIIDDYGGPGSGHHGHKGIPGQRGGSSSSGAGVRLGGGGIQVSENADVATIDEWAAQVETWEGKRQGMAGAAIGAIRSGDTAVTIPKGGELQAIAAIGKPHERQGLFGPEIIGDNVSIMFLATKERGYGYEMMQGVANVAAEGGWSLSLNATDGSLGFYQKIGMNPISTGSKAIHLSGSEVKEWIK
jgi:hypothetical protein